MELEVVRVVLMEPGRHRMQEVLKMMRQGMKLEILPGMRIQGVRMMSLVARIPDPEPGSGSEVSVDVSLPVKWQEDGQAVCHVVFEFNNEEIVEHCPVETWHSGKHILSLYYPIEKIVANYTNTFNVYLWMEYGSGTVDVGDCIASVSGQAMAAGEAWDGKLEVEDYTTRFAIGGGLDVNGFRESLSMQMKETVNRGFEVYFAERAGISGFCRPVEMEGV